jgi:hypothetical protein
MARKPNNLVVQENEISQTIDLDKWLGKDFSSDPDLVREIGQSVIDYMIKRVDDNKGLGGETLKPSYSTEYSKSLDFKAAGKSKNDVNMKLSGDMLGSIDLEESGNSFKIFVDGDEEIIKAYGHMTGFKGHPTIPKNKYKRQFFGLTKEEFKKEIAPKFKGEKPKETERDLVGELIKAIKTADNLFDIGEE